MIKTFICLLIITIFTQKLALTKRILDNRHSGRPEGSNGPNGPNENNDNNNFYHDNDYNNIDGKNFLKCRFMHIFE
jgi:hypothetical protein